MIFSLQEYKKARLVVQDLYQVKAHLVQQKKQLAPYGKYKPVKQLYASIMETQAEIMIHIKNCEKIIRSKGSLE